VSDETPALVVEGLRYSYGRREALRGVSFRVERGELFGLLGPNGGGKSTLFRILATLQRPSGGRALLLGYDAEREPAAVRARIGVVFQHASVDAYLTVEENLTHHGALWGMPRQTIAERIEVLLARFGLTARRHELVGQLSGGLARRIEIAKGILPRPALLLMDEPSTGLDPAARRELMGQLDELRASEGTTIVLTTHHMEEAERCDRLALLDRGELVASDTPANLRGRVGGDVVTIRAADLEGLQAHIHETFGIEAARVDGTLRIEHGRGHELVHALVDRFPDAVQSATFGRPTLEDAFIRLTGHALYDEERPA